MLIVSPEWRRLTPEEVRTNRTPQHSKHTPSLLNRTEKTGLAPARGNGRQENLNKLVQHNQQQLVPQRGLHKRSCSPVRELPKKSKLTQSSTKQQLVWQTSLHKRPSTSLRELPQNGSSSWEEKIPSVKREGTKMNQMTVVPQVASSNKSRVHNDKPNNHKGWKEVRRQVNLMHSKILLLEQAAGGISGVSPEM